MSPLIDDNIIIVDPLGSYEGYSVETNDKDHDQRRVAFFHKVEVLEIPSRSELTEEDISKLWFSGEDVLVSREEQRLTIQKMENGEEVDDENLCSHGLQTDDERDIRKLTAHEALHEVLAEHQMQWEEGMEDPELLADVYFECSSYNQRLARDRGLQHANAMAELYGLSLTKLPEKNSFRKPMSRFFVHPGIFEGKGDLLTTSASVLMTTALDLVSGQ